LRSTLFPHFISPHICQETVLPTLFRWYSLLPCMIERIHDSRNELKARPLSIASFPVNKSNHDDVSPPEVAATAACRSPNDHRARKPTLQENPWGWNPLPSKAKSHLTSPCFPVCLESVAVGEGGEIGLSSAVWCGAEHNHNHKTQTRKSVHPSLACLPCLCSESRCTGKP
jgi:hypothetical protein